MSSSLFPCFHSAGGGRSSLSSGREPQAATPAPVSALPRSSLSASVSPKASSSLAMCSWNVRSHCSAALSSHASVNILPSRRNATPIKGSCSSPSTSVSHKGWFSSLTFCDLPASLTDTPYSIKAAIQASASRLASSSNFLCLQAACLGSNFGLKLVVNSMSSTTPAALCAASNSTTWPLSFVASNGSIAVLDWG
eukprot:CAMPEP_0172668742 /NCGR_PEP_ID=MMETSP1074-20121228/9247_1 /TAXON_ID=2916 /ORGANISM="Ceratium fusus, Strain PA161109" /LENGTH=194 /DNA_ID=CAMNT_0013485423 /DNA_START=271 /DNA_END=855 /DNA_ORIENTATION=+